MRTLQKLIPVIGIALAAGNCDSHTAPPVTVDPTIPATITLTASSSGTLTSAGDTRTFMAVVKNASGGIIASPNLQWSSSSPDVVSVTSDASNNAVATANSDGTANVVVRSGSVETTTPLVVRRAVASILLTSVSDKIEFGSTMQLITIAYDARHQAMPAVQQFTYVSSNPAAISVSATGHATALFKFPQLPEAIITASVTRDGTTTSSSIKLTAAIPSSTEFGSLMLTLYVLPVRPPGLGAGLAFMTRSPDYILYRVLWTDLSGVATNAQIRGPGGPEDIAELLVELGPLPPPESIPVINGLIRSADIKSQSGRPPISIDSLAVLMCNGQAYIQIGTARFPAGEIRGRVDCVR
ncbi:MAG: CHRD domain-containing protein [Phycisphaerae bacterium]|nr:CHRD domain-containing protein [Gemmatimonadaceae bacterium]